MKKLELLSLYCFTNERIKSTDELSTMKYANDLSAGVQLVCGGLGHFVCHLR